MYTKIHTQKDVLRERYLYQSELTPLGFPKLLPVHAALSGLNAVSFCEAVKEKNPKKALCHFFIDDARFEPLWNQPQKYLPMLENFKYVCAPDFSFYDSMPKVVQLHQVYRSRALAWWLFMNGCDVIPTVGWGNAETFDFALKGCQKRVRWQSVQTAALPIKARSVIDRASKKCVPDSILQKF